MMKLENEDVSNIVLDLKEIRSRLQMQSYRAAELLLETVIRMMESRRGEDRP